MTALLNKDKEASGKQQPNQNSDDQLFYCVESKYANLLIKVKKDDVPDFLEKLTEMPFEVEVIGELY